MIRYEPTIIDNPVVNRKRPSGWGDIPTILKDIIIKFNLKTKICLEFGVEFGYSTSALSNYFEQVIGVDTFLGDIHTADKGDHYDRTLLELSEFKNINLIKSDFNDFILDEKNDLNYDIIHIDIVHLYEPTYKCGEWSVQRSPITLFHDTMLFSEMYKVCEDLSKKYDLDFYNYEKSNGLGILHNKNIKK